MAARERTTRSKWRYTEFGLAPPLLPVLLLEEHRWLEAAGVDAI